MSITTTMGLLRFALLCIDLLAWPVIALGYPLFASIRAVETGSKYHMKKMVIYWTLFSLCSLFEFAFVKIIEWIPFWSSVRLVVILWLVMPQFDGACHAYQALVRPIFLVKLQAVFDRFYKLKDESLCKSETVLDVVEKYIKENGSEAMEKLIALEHESQKCIDSRRDTKVLEAEGTKAAVTSKLMNERPNAARRGTDMFEATEKSAATKNPQVLNGADVATIVKEMTPPEARRPETPPLMKTEQEYWTCDMCKVKTTNEITLSAHLQGRKHTSKLESLKARMLNSKDTGPSPSQRKVQHTQSASEVKEMKPPKQTPPLKKAHQEWSCDLCKVTTSSEITLNGHFHGSKHKSNLEALKASKPGPPSSATSKLNHGNVAEKSIKESGSKSEKLIANKVQTAAVASGETRRPEQVKGHQEWRCDLCNVTTTSEKTLNAHLKGSKHEAEFESLKRSKLSAKDIETFTHYCLVCDVKLLSDVDLASHLKGKRHSSNVDGFALAS